MNHKYSEVVDQTPMLLENLGYLEAMKQLTSPEAFKELYKQIHKIEKEADEPP